MAWVLGIFVYFSDSFSPLFVGSTMRSITDKARISREKLAYIADSTSAPVSVLVPITGFANSVASPALEYKAEGQVFGVGCKIFTIAGPVILYGILSSWGLGVVYWGWMMLTQ